MKVSARSGFTLLELLVVVAILAIIAGGLIAAYDGLEEKSAQGASAFTMAAMNDALRNYRATNNGYFPDDYDSLMFSTSGDGTDGTELNILPTELKNVLSAYTLTAESALTLQRAGISEIHYVSGTLGYDNDPVSSGGTQPEVPARVFDLQPVGSSNFLGSATHVELAASVTVASINDVNLLRNVAALDPALTHVVVAFGIGNNCSLVKPHEASATDSRAAKLAEAPFYKNVLPGEYNRYIALYHLGTSTDNTLANVTYFNKARLVSVIDTNGHWYEEELAHHLGSGQ